MRHPRFYTGQALSSGATLELEPGPSQHIARALRMQVGQAVVLFDGRGGEYPATILALGKKAVAVQCGEHRQHELESCLSIHLGIALSRGDRMDWVVQKSTELGVAAITPLLSDRTGVKLVGERVEKKVRHWQQIAISACEQCGRNRIPDVGTPQTLATWVERTEADLKLVLHHRAGSITAPDEGPDSLALLVGPEGGLSGDEVELAAQRGFTPLRLGRRVLRTETAPLAAIAIAQAYWGDMGPGTP